MANYFTDNKDLVFHFDNLKLEEIVKVLEEDYTQKDKFPFAPVDYEDAMDSYRRVLEVVGDISANFIAPRAESVDQEGNVLKDGKVIYAKGTRESLEKLSQAELMGMTLPREYGGLNFPTTIYMMAIEMVSRADASLMNLFGLQDIAETINRYGSKEQKKEFLPGFASGKFTGAMALTEPDAGSDLQSVKLMAYQDESGTWRLKGVKRFITNGCGDVLLVLARSEPGTKDARGLSLFVCYGDDTVVVRRIENKLGIHGSPTCELQFNDTPAQLVGKRRFGLIKYVMDLMNGARLGVSAQALGIAQAAYEEALKYAKERIQFGKPIYNIPAVTNMLIDMRISLEACRSLLYSTSYWVDLRNALEKKIDQLKKEGKDFSEYNRRLKEATKVANLLTPMTKYVLTETANRICYDALQVHGGTGYMKEFVIERLYRDVRITNIYEGTTQMQVVAAIGGVINDVLGDYFEEKTSKSYKGNLDRYNEILKNIREIFMESLEFVKEKKDPDFQDIAAKELVELYSYLYVGYLLLEEAEKTPHKIYIANRYIINALAKAKMNREVIRNEQFSDIIHADEILN